MDDNFPLQFMNEKKSKGRKFRSPKLTRLEALTKGLLTDPKDVKAMFTIKEVEGKGRGVFLRAPVLPKDSFVLEYEGDIISETEAQSRERIYAHNNEGCFIMSFTFKGSKWAIDATRRFDSFTRLLNHSRRPNIRFHPPIVIDLNGKGLPRIAAYALRDIYKGEEIVFDYGVRDGSIEWLRNRKGGYRNDVDSSDASCVEEEEEEDDDDDDDDDDDTGSSATGDCNMSFKISPVKPIDSNHIPPRIPIAQPSHDPILSGFDEDSDRTKPRRGVKRRSFCAGEWGLRFTCLIPGSLEKSYMAGYESIGIPQKIMKRVEDELKKRKVRFDSDSVICLSSSSDDSMKGSGSSSALQTSSAFNNGSRSELAVSNRNSCMELPCNKEPNSIHKVLEWQIPSPSEDNPLNIKIVGVQSLSDPPHEEASTSYAHTYEQPCSSQRQQNFINFHAQEIAQGASSKDVEPPRSLPQQQLSQQHCNPNISSSIPISADAPKDIVSIDLSESDHDDESSSLPSLRHSPVDKAAASEPSTARTSGPIRINNKNPGPADVFIVSDDECESKPSQRKSSERACKKRVTNKNSCGSESPSSECEIVSTEKPGSSKQVGKLANNLPARRPVGYSPVPLQVAVIKPFQGFKPSPSTSSQESLLPEPQQEDLTESEQERLKTIFGCYVFSSKAADVDIQETIYENWDFFKALIDRGISVNQIRATVRNFFK